MNWFKGCIKCIEFLCVSRINISICLLYTSFKGDIKSPNRKSLCIYPGLWLALYIEAVWIFFFLFFFFITITLHWRLPLLYIAGLSTQVFLPRMFNIITNRHINNKRIIMYTFLFLFRSLYMYKQLFTIENRLPYDSIFNLTKGPTVCYLSCRGVNCRKTLFWPLQNRRPS